MSTFTILLGGVVVPTGRLLKQVAGTRVIAADSGIRHAKALAVEPELWVGDFDSATDLHFADHSDVPLLRFAPEKDKTDGEIAVETALGRGASRLILCGAFGGARADHAFLHLTLALRLSEAGHPVLLTSGSQEAWPLLGGRRTSPIPPFPEGATFSLMAFTDLDGLSVEGAKWELEDVQVPFGSSLTLSNVITGRLGVRLDRGRALLLVHIKAT
jgi:thiamine pyrophosphokinase